MHLLKVYRTLILDQNLLKSKLHCLVLFWMEVMDFGSNTGFGQVLRRRKSENYRRPAKNLLENLALIKVEVSLMEFGLYDATHAPG